jgi:hypothetical protein
MTIISAILAHGCIPVYTMTDDNSAAMRQWRRREYLRQHAGRRRATAKSAGAKRIDVTLDERDRDDFERVKQWLDDNNRLGIERGFYNTPKTLPDGTTFTVPPARLSDREIIKTALRLAVGAIEDEKKGR